MDPKNFSAGLGPCSRSGGLRNRAAPTAGISAGCGGGGTCNGNGGATVRGTKRSTDAFLRGLLLWALRFNRDMRDEARSPGRKFGGNRWIRVDNLEGTAG